MATSPAVAPSTIEVTTIRKLRSHIIPFVFVLFVIAFIDRINIGFAALTMSGPYAIGALGKKTGSLHAGLVFVGFSLFASALLILALQQKAGLETPSQSRQHRRVKQFCQ
jgi:hypothetical protein